MTAPDRASGAAITVVRIHYVKDGCEQQFEQRLQDLMGAFRAIPANLGVTVFRPGKHNDGVYRIVYRFASRGELDRWHASPAYLAWVETEKNLTIAPPRMEVLTGLETWFTLPGQHVVKPPTKLRQAVVTWIAVLPVSCLISLMTSPILVDQSFLVQKIVFVTLLVTMLTWVVMPVMTRVFAPLLYPPEEESPSPDPDILS